MITTNKPKTYVLCSLFLSPRITRFDVRVKLQFLEHIIQLLPA